jgi:hypothetical protein
MKRTQRILDRFPSFYKTWDRNSLIFNMVHALGKRLDEAEKDLYAIMWAHWVDKASGSELDQLGDLYNIKRKPDETDSAYRNRLKRAIMEFKGGGTINAVLTSVKTALGLPRDYPLELIENPPKEMYKEFKVRTGETWLLSSSSVLDAAPSIEINVETEGLKSTNPTITNLGTGEVIALKGTLQKGEVLRIEGGKVFLSDVDVTERLSKADASKLLRRGSTWRYAEALEKEIGVFDAAAFDLSIFAIGIPTVNIGFKWVAYQPATFEIRMPKDALPTKGSIALVQEVVESIKAAGVRAIINVVEG